MAVIMSSDGQGQSWMSHHSVYLPSNHIVENLLKERTLNMLTIVLMDNSKTNIFVSKRKKVSYNFHKGLQQHLPGLIQAG